MCSLRPLSFLPLPVALRPRPGRATALPKSTISCSSVAAVYDRRKFSLRSVIFLQAADADFGFLERTNAVRASQGRSHRRHDRDLFRERGVADADFVFTRNFSARRVNDEIDLAILDQVAHVGPPFAQFENL